MTGPVLAHEMGLSRRLLPAPAIPTPGLLVGGMVGLLAVAVLGLVGAGIAQEHAAPAQRLLAPGAIGHPLGTDQLGRDVLARTLAGFRWSLVVVLPATLIAGLAGTGLGLAAAEGARPCVEAVRCRIALCSISRRLRAIISACR